ncbi:MAG TPA: hypothetical protein ENN69_02850 [Spirochaetia bacterium]|nr:hypothetical protein [Spirochaetia bacterium]
MEELESEERIGQFLVKIGAVTQAQVEEILRIQDSRSDALFGIIAIEKGYINDEALKRYLDAKSRRGGGSEP